MFYLWKLSSLLVSLCMYERLLCVMRCSSDFFFFKQKTAYEMRISDWSSDVCSSDLPDYPHPGPHDRDDQQAGPHIAPDAARDRPRADARGVGRQARHAAGEGPQGPEDRKGADQPGDADRRRGGDRKSTRLNSSH